jgi:hypothetical protein
MRLEQLDQVGAGLERVGDRGVLEGRVGGAQVAVDLADQELPGGERAGVQLGQVPQTRAVGNRRES